MSTNPDKQIILITGATAGIGFDTTVYLAGDSPNNHIIMGARNPTKAATKVQEAQAKNPKGTISWIELDTNSDDSINAAVAQIKKDFGRLDVLINNAGISTEDESKVWTTRANMRAIFETNVYGPTVLSEVCIPLLKHSKNAMIINVTSGLGSIGGMDPTIDSSNVLKNFQLVRGPGYRMSKAALNFLTAYQHWNLKDEGIKVWSYCPGYVATDLSGDVEKRMNQAWCESSETSAQGILDVVHGERDGEVGGFVTKRGGSYPW